LTVVVPLGQTQTCAGIGFSPTCIPLEVTLNMPSMVMTFPLMSLRTAAFSADGLSKPASIMASSIMSPALKPAMARKFGGVW